MADTGKTGASTAYVPAGASHVRRAAARYSVRLWSVRHAALLERIYGLLADALLRLHWLWNLLGYARVERPMVFLESRVKGFMFDCRMCGQCMLSDSGMSCPMNCPKGVRNGPCGGVLDNGNCEIEPDMPCVWVQAWKGSQLMQAKDNIRRVQRPLDHSLRGTSAWLRVTAATAAKRHAARAEAGGRRS